MEINKNGNNENTIKQFPVNYNLRPKYYDEFQCKAQDCKVTCCAGWGITMNRKDYLKMRSQRGSEEFNQKIKKALHRIKNGPSEDFYAEINCNENQCCPLCTEEGLCSLQIECGFEALPKVCKKFPRAENAVYSGYLEHSLTLGCEAVLELLWDLPEGIDFVSDELPQSEKMIGSCSTSSPNLYFQEIRSLCIDLLQDRRFPVRQRILLMGLFLQKLPFDVAKVPQWCIETEQAIQSAALLELSQGLCQTTEDMTKKYVAQNMQILIQPALNSKNSVLEEYHKKLLSKFLCHTESEEEENDGISINLPFYQQCKKRFLQTFGDMEYFFENIMVSLFFHYSLPILSSKEDMWKEYVGFCNLYSLLRFVAITSCTEDGEQPKEQLIKAIVWIAREILHSRETNQRLKEIFFENESASLAHMAVLLSE